MRVRLLMRAVTIGTVAALALTPALAQQKKHDHDSKEHKHSHPTAQHGGVLEDVGEYHAELLVKDGKIALHLRDHDAKDASAAGFKASVLLTAGSQRVGPVELTPAGANKLEGPVGAVPAGATAILTLTDAGGATAQGRFKLK